MSRCAVRDCITPQQPGSYLCRGHEEDARRGKLLIPGRTLDLGIDFNEVEPPEGFPSNPDGHRHWRETRPIPQPDKTPGRPKR